MCTSLSLIRPAQERARGQVSAAITRCFRSRCPRSLQPVQPRVGCRANRGPGRAGADGDPDAAAGTAIRRSKRPEAAQGGQENPNERQGGQEGLGKEKEEDDDNKQERERTESPCRDGKGPARDGKGPAEGADGPSLNASPDGIYGRSAVRQHADAAAAAAQPALTGSAERARRPAVPVSFRSERRGGVSPGASNTAQRSRSRPAGHRPPRCAASPGPAAGRVAGARRCCAPGRCTGSSMS